MTLHGVVMSHCVCVPTAQKQAHRNLSRAEENERKGKRKLGSPSSFIHKGFCCPKYVARGFVVTNM